MRRWLLKIILSSEERRAIRTYWRCGCTCGVITNDDGRDWEAAQKVLPALLEDLAE